MDKCSYCGCPLEGYVTMDVPGGKTHISSARCSELLKEERDRLLLQLSETETARQTLWKKLVLVILATGGPVNVNKLEAELFDGTKYQLIEIDSFNGRDYVLKVGEKKKAT